LENTFSRDRRGEGGEARHIHRAAGLPWVRHHLLDGDGESAS